MAATATATFKVSPNLPGIIARVATGLFDGVTSASELIRDDAKLNCPVDTGDLRESIDAKVTRGIQLVMQGGPIKDSSFAVQGVVSPHMPYAGYVEFGTGVRGASSPGAGAGPYNPNWPGMVAQPYMRPAIDENREAAVDTIRAAVKDALG